MATRIKIGRRYVDAKRLVLKPYEAAYVLRCSERDVRNMLRRGQLHACFVGRLRSVDATDVAERVGEDALAALVLAALAEDRIRAPRAQSPELPAPSLVFCPCPPLSDRNESRL